MQANASGMCECAVVVLAVRVSLWSMLSNGVMQVMNLCVPMSYNFALSLGSLLLRAFINT